MRTRPVRVPKHCLHRPTAQGYVRLSGRTFYTGHWGSVAAEALYEQLISQWLAAGRSLPRAWSTEQAYVVEDLAADFLEWAETYYVKEGRPTSEVHVIRCALRVLLAAWGRLPVEEFGPAKLKTYREQLIRQDLARTTINKLVHVVKRMFRWGVEEEKVPGSVMEGLRCVSGLRQGRTEARQPEAIRPVCEADMLAVLPHVSQQVAAMIQLQWLTGMRPGEVVQMRTGDLDRSGSVWLYAPQSHKTEHHGKARTVPLGPQAQHILAPFLKLDPVAPLFSPGEAEAERLAVKRRERKTKVQPSQVARHLRAAANPARLLREAYTSASYGRAIARACTKAGIQPWSPNQLRHAAATRIRKAFGLEAARVVLGHTSAAMTEVYAEIDAAKATAIMEQVG